MKTKTKRDAEKVHSAVGFVARLRRLADALEAGQPFSIQVAGERVTVPALAIFSIEHERNTVGEELEFQLKWKRKPKSRPDIVPIQTKDRERSKHEKGNESEQEKHSQWRPARVEADSF